MLGGCVKGQRSKGVFLRLFSEATCDPLCVFVVVIRTSPHLFSASLPVITLHCPVQIKALKKAQNL